MQIEMTEHPEWLNVKIPIWKRIEFWKSQKIKDDKGGSFNLELYLAVCKAKQNDDGKSNS